MVNLERPDERKAIEILKIAYPEKYKDAFLVDKPDIQSPEKGIGVEVTQSLKESVLRVLARDGISVQQEDKVSIAIKERYPNGLIPIELPLSDKNKKQVTISIEHWHSLYDLIQSYDSKMKKLQNGNYKIYQQNNLFVFVYGETIATVQKLLQHIKTLSGRQYDFIYVYSQPFLYTIDLEKEAIQQRIVKG